MVTRLQAVTRIKRGLAFRTSLDDECVEELQTAQKRFETGHTLPHWLIQEDQTLAFTAGNPSAALPTGFLRQVRDQDPYYQLLSTDTPIFLQKKSWEDAFEAYATTDPGAPEVYVLRKSTLRVFPTPDVAYNLVWSYYKADALLLADSTENLWLTHAPNLLIGVAGKKLAQDIGLPDAVQKFSEMIAESWAELFAQSEEWEAAGRDYHVGAGL